MKLQMMDYHRDSEGNFVADLAITSDTNKEVYRDSCNLNNPKSRRRFVRFAIDEIPLLSNSALEDEIDGFLNKIAKEWKNKYVYFDDKGKAFINDGLLFQDILTEFHFKSLRDTEEVLVYKDGIYCKNGEVFIKEQIEKKVDYPLLLTRHYMDEMVGRVVRNTYTDRKDFNSEKWLLNLENGLLDTQTLNFSPHTPDFLSTIRMPIKYDPKAECPRIYKFFTEILDAENVPLMEEIFAYCLVPDFWIQRTFLFIGGGENGKSTLINLLHTFLGPANCSGVSMQSFALPRSFHIAELYGKLANLHSDLSSKALQDTGPLKMLTGGDPINAEEKFKKPFSFINSAKLIFSANKPPQIIGEDSHAFWRRWVIINFPNEFPQGAKTTDKHMLKKLCVPEELSGLLNLILPKIKTLWEEGVFSYKPTVEEVTEQYLRASDPVYAFLQDTCEADPESYIPKEELYLIFQQYCVGNKLPILKPNSFSRGLTNQIFVRLKSARHRLEPNGPQVRCWDGLKFQEPEENREGGGNGNNEVEEFLKSMEDL